MTLRDLLFILAVFSGAVWGVYSYVKLDQACADRGGVLVRDDATGVRCTVSR